MEVLSDILYLKKDRSCLIDNDANVIFSMQLKDGEYYYQSVSLESEAFEKICIKTAPRKVCVDWDKQYVCLEWEEVEVCTQSQLIPRGFSNIS